MAHAPAPDDGEPGPLLERLGLRYLERRAAFAGPRTDDGDNVVHVLDARERAELRRLQAWAVLRAALVGGLSALAAGLADLGAVALLGSPPEVTTAEYSLRYWGLVAPVIVAASLGELVFLYRNSLSTVERLARTAGLDLSPGSRDARRAQVVTGLVRAALELPNPPRTALGIDPRRESSRLALVVAGVVYKAKVKLTNFLLKALLRQLLGRSVVRAVLTFAAVPVSALWDGIVTWLVLREARIRVLGPSASRELVQTIFDAGPREPSAAARALALRAVASAIVRSHDLHPNLEALFLEVRDRVGPPAETGLDDSAVFLARLPGLAAEERRLVLRLLAVATVIDGRLARDERRLLRQAQRACGLAPDLTPVERLRRAFVAGDAVPREVVLALGC